MNQKPEMVVVIAIIMIVSGAINVLWGIGVSLLLVFSIIGIFCIPLGLIPLGIGIFEIVQGVNILNDRPVKNITLVGILEIASILWGNIFSLVGGILVLVFYNDEQNKAYLDGIALNIITPAE